MVRAVRAKKFKKPQVKEQYDSDDPEGYKDMPVPDKRSAKYTKDKIDEFHDAKISKLLASGVKMDDSDKETDDDDEEVLALDVSDEEEDDVEEEEQDNEEEDDMDSDLDGKQEDGLPNEQAWGKKKKAFYDSDYVATKGKTAEEVAAEDAEEEEEAKNIQKRLAADLTEEDYDLNFLQEFAVEDKEVEKSAEKEERIVKDLEQMSQKEKMKLLRKESPELLELIQDFKAKLAELKNELQPLLEMVRDGRIPPGKGADYLKTKQQLYQNYCTNISFYLVLKAKRIPAHNHPVIERLVTYRNLINKLSEVDARLGPQVRLLLAGQKKEKVARKPGNESRKATMSGDTAPEAAESSGDSDLDEEAALQFYRQVEERLKLKRKSKDPTQLDDGVEEGEDEEMDEEAKRAITYQMAKNKGLTPKRKKIDRNPRVKHREKFRRAKIRRKGQVREVRREETRYSGELSGIRAGVKKGVKLK